MKAGEAVCFGVLQKFVKFQSSLHLLNLFNVIMSFEIKQDLMEEVKPKLDEEMQDILDCLGSGAEEDATKLYEAMKVS